MKKHDLKILTEFFDDVSLGNKTFEIRKNDRDFKKGDVLMLHEYNPKTGRYTGSRCDKYVRYIMHGGKFGIEDGYCIMGIE